MIARVQVIHEGIFCPYPSLVDGDIRRTTPCPYRIAYRRIPMLVRM